MKLKEDSVLKEVVDQILHFLWAFIALLPIIYFGPTFWSGGLSGLFLCLPRELVDQWHGWPIGWKKWMDIAFFVLGGMAVGFFIG